ncbi:MAG TPA: phosphoglycerate kinase, partial [Myxococcota bacterium]|nr:phosphoglycerate kinase [Myxococcota bacterium]
MKAPTLDSLIAAGVKGRRVLVRADLNVPLRDGAVADDARIRASLPTLERLLAAGARVVVVSHLGRPKGERRPELSLAPVAQALGEALGRKAAFCSECVGPEAEAAVAALGDGELLVLENLRFHAGETANDPEFAQALARLADDYVNDAFGTAHRAHASTAGVVARVERVAAGDLLATEVEHLRMVLEPERPFVCLLGGA